MFYFKCIEKSRVIGLFKKKKEKSLALIYKINHIIHLLSLNTMQTWYCINNSIECQKIQIWILYI